MFGYEILKKSVKTAALAVPLIVGFTVYASAHSEGACANNVVDSCNAAGGSTEAVNLCIINGLNACHTHSHSGGGGSGSSASNDKTSEPDTEQSRTPGFVQKFQKKQRRYKRYRSDNPLVSGAIRLQKAARAIDAGSLLSVA